MFEENAYTMTGKMYSYHKRQAKSTIETMKKRFNVIDVSPVRQETISAKEFLRLSTQSPHLIARSRYVAPTIGQRDFGRFEVRYSVPILKHKEVA